MSTAVQQGGDVNESNLKSLILLSVLFCSFSVNACSSPKWEEFLKEPDKDSLVRLENAISASAQRCSWGKPDNPDIAPTDKQNIQLFELITRGNESAFHAALLVSRCLDGGELEDFYRSAGIFLEVQPRAFLQITKRMEIPYSQLRPLGTMLPLDMVDDLDRKISTVEKRISILTGISEGSLQDTKEQALSFLEKEKQVLDRIKTEVKKAK
jgi:hypothetical protein